MKRNTRRMVATLVFCALFSATASADDPLKIWFDKPAADWNEAVPIGNGRLGAMIFGGVPSEDLQINDNTLYSGEPGDRDLPLDVAKDLGQVRQWLREGKYAEVHKWVTKHWLGRAQNCYEPLGDLRMDFHGSGEVKKYARELDISDAISRVTYEQDGVTFTREVFASHPARAIVIHLHASRPGALNLTLRMDSPHPTAVSAIVGHDTLELKGKTPGLALRRSLTTVEHNGETWRYPELYDKEGHLLPGATAVMYGDKIGGRGTRFAARLIVESTDGKCSSDKDSLSIQGAADAVLILASGSSFNGFDKSPSRDGKDETAEPIAILNDAANKSFDQFKEEHTKDYHALFDRVALNVAPATEQSAMATPERIKRYAGGGDEALASLYYQFGRYLLIAGSRSGEQPLNLQGMWNPHVVPPWAGAYTLNINLEMNYWPVEVANLTECSEPLMRMIGELSVNGRKVAHDMYGLPGWVAHHNTTIWRDAQPVDGDSGPAFWDMAGPWLCQHLWTHYQFTGDDGFLRSKAYPVMKGAAEFMAAWLVQDDHGHLVTPIGTSPENKFLYIDAAGHRSSASLIPGPTMDIALVRDLFTNCILASERLGVDKAFRDELKDKVARLRPYEIGKQNRLQEWPIDFADEEPTHRHVSHVWGLFPGSQISARETPELAAAAAQTLNLRGDLATGWSLAWKINLWAHLDNGDRAHKCLAYLLSPERSYPNLFDSCPPFQIDGNFGAASGIQEMLMQSRPDEIELLPALPSSWPVGRFQGLCAKGGYVVSCEWGNSRLVSATLRARRAATCRVRYAGKVVVLSFNAGQQIRLNGDLSRAALAALP